MMRVRNDVLWFGVLLSVQSCALDTAVCKDATVDEVRSPNGRYSAFILSRHCGPTTGVTTHLQVVSGGETPSMTTASLLAIDDTARWTDTTAKERMRHRDMNRVGVQWVTNDTLVVMLDPRARLIHSKGLPPAGVQLKIRTLVLSDTSTKGPAR